MLHCLGDDCSGSRCWRYNSSFVGIPFASTNWIHIVRRTACHTRPWQVRMASQVLNLQGVSNFPATPQSFPSGAVAVIKIQGKLCFFQSHLEVHMASVITKPAIEYLPLQTWRQNPKLPPDLKAKSKGSGMRMTNVSPQKPWIFSLAIQSAIGQKAPRIRSAATLHQYRRSALSKRYAYALSLRWSQWHSKTINDPWHQIGSDCMAWLSSKLRMKIHWPRIPAMHAYCYACINT